MVAGVRTRRVHGKRAGSEFGLADAYGHRVVGRDRNPRVDLRNRRLPVPGLGRDGHTRCLRDGRHPEAKNHRATDRSSRGEEFPAIHVCRVLWGCLSFWLLRLLLSHDDVLFSLLRPAGLAFAPLMPVHARSAAARWIAWRMR